MQRYPRPHPQTAGRVIDREAVLILADNSEVNVLNEVGSRIFELADGGRTVAGIAAIIAAEYDVSAERAAADTAEFVSLLVRHDVLVLTEGGDSDS